MYRHWSILYRNQSTHVSTPTAQLTVVSLKVTTLIDSCTEPGRLINRSWFARVPTKIDHLLATLDSCNNIRRPNCAFCEMWAVSATRMLPLFYFCSFMFFDRSDEILESMNIQIQNCASIQCTVWPRNEPWPLRYRSCR